MRFIAFIVLLLAAPFAAAQTFPAKPIRVIVPSPPGDGSDVMARLIGEKLTAAWGQQVVVDNRPGAGGRIGTEAAAKAPADGYTWIMANAGSHGINGGLYRNLPYDLEKDFAPITQIMRAPNALVVSPSLGVKNVGELIALLKKNPGKYSYGSGGNGSSAHLSAELFKQHGGRRRGAHPVQGRHHGAHRPDRRQHRDVHGQPAAGDGPHQGRPHPGARRHHAQALASWCRSCRRWTKPG